METPDALSTQLRKHLTFAGYEVIDEEDEMWIATHLTQFKFFLRQFKGGVLFAAFFEAKEKVNLQTPGFPEFINHLNFNSAVARFYFHTDAVCAECWFSGPYESGYFSRFFDTWKADVLLNFERQKTAGEKFLK